MKTQNGPRLRWRVSTRNHYEGDYKKHRVTVWRNSERRPWHFLVTGPDGIHAADGQMRERTTRREAIIYAVRGALLWPNPAGEPRPPANH
jgi:hypothetical protein